MKQCPRTSAIVLECADLPPYADAIREATQLPVWDAVTGADFYMSAFQDRPRYELDDWLKEDHKPDVVEKVKRNLQQKQNPILGVMRSDSKWSPASADSSCSGSNGYTVLFRKVPGL